ncbi:uncharacterized protein K452DRAFT_239210 [Aplosporella prunicola CBS 121167]|uniref:DUF747-domain-containing protein n=1 Tax=Aplosporella prunicola CBS 121167 TaxID=1176127 RepID=A0A6A6AX24_9PEZI|nr:uncharacterized protein K452DRAFT_239210 [Aplosporella prunicola CBS 121167]KAF2135535.1 hypothetical protein K452DRAFT_239210 [Aplosporella prunicola CBS 121167]
MNSDGQAEQFPPLSPNAQLPTPAATPTLDHGDALIGLGLTASPEDTKHGPVADKSNDSRQLRSDKPRKSSTGTPASPRVRGVSDGDKKEVLKLSPARIQELTESPNSLPVRPAAPLPDPLPSLSESPVLVNNETDATTNRSPDKVSRPHRMEQHGATEPAPRPLPSAAKSSRPLMPSRTVSTPPVLRRKHSSRGQTPSMDSTQPRISLRPAPLNFDEAKPSGTPGGLKPSAIQETPLASPMPASIPLPPLSIPTYLQLELASERPSPLYIHRSATSDFPYESSRIKFERLLNFLILPFELEQSLWFGALACLDAWLYTFTILPLRFFKAVWILAKWWSRNAFKEARDIVTFIYGGLGRVWERRQGKAPSTPALTGEEHTRKPSSSHSASSATGFDANAIRFPPLTEPTKRPAKQSIYRHRRLRSVPSTLMPNHKADILKGLLVLSTCIILSRFDASKTYHNIRGQAAIKLYVIYNVLEVCDRLFSALGQDILECLLSRETLDRNADGRSKIIRPFWMFLLALVYNSIHATALFYQVITLNVAVNSYSNALLTLLMSNQFVEIKGTVFKKFEKENLFQLTCADMVERFQLWLMLMIIAFRNIVEVGGLTINVGGSSSGGSIGNITSAPFKSTSIIPKSFTIFPKWTGQVLGPFLLVLGSEMLVDWLKHAYITKFNNTKPALYSRFLDVLAKDYYSHAFADQNLTKRLGLPVLPLACLFIRATIQTYHMFLATHMPLPIPSTATAIAVDESSATSSPATTAALAHIDHIFRRALGRSSFGAGVVGVDGATGGFSWWSLDDVIAFATMLVVFLAAYFVLLLFKLVLGMCLLSFARSRYHGMKEREKMVVTTDGKRLGGWGVVEVEDDKKRWIYADDPEGYRMNREREQKGKEKDKKGGEDLGLVQRYSMVAKRIW